MNKHINASDNTLFQLSEYDNVPVDKNQSDMLLCGINYQTINPVDTGFMQSAYYVARVSDVLLCRQIELEEHEYNITEDHTLSLHRHNIMINYTQYDTTPNNKIRICYRVLEKYEFFGSPTR